ncbi:hypothetical protein DK847_16470 [Aestuariivirga litoralis]|uniref:Uncharacterized protein n=1 Tax=Aestuariivirga litoralis TaxID=2650924 RepID=A0A2W2BR03_9HYPH|nr:hypothetical protein DK847_16470 [Aestuariivirga litoralis]
MHGEDDDFHLNASFRWLHDAVAYCKLKIDDQILGYIQASEANEADSAKLIAEAQEQLSLLGYN